MTHELFEAVAACHEAKLSEILAGEPDAVTACDDTGRQPLHAAAECGFVEGIRRLLDVGAPRNACDHRLWTPLFHAIAGRHVEIARMLLDADAAVTVTDRNGRSVLHAAAGFGEPFQPQMVRLLIESGALVNARARGGATPLHYAALVDDCGAARMLLAAGADPNIICNEEITPLWWAVARGCDEMLRILLEAGASTEFTNLAGLTPLGLAVARGDEVLVERLLAAGADIKVRQPITERTLLHFAAAYGYSRIEEGLCGTGLRQDVRDIEGCTPSDLRSRYGHHEPTSSRFAERDVEVGQANLIYLGGNGWCVRTAEACLVFDPPERGCLPRTASPRSGTLRAEDLEGWPVTYFLGQHGDVRLLPRTSDLSDGASSPFSAGDAVNPQGTIVSPGIPLDVTGASILPLGFEAPAFGVSYVVTSGGMTVLHWRDASYFHPRYDEALEAALAEIGRFSGQIDVALIEVPAGRHPVCLPTRRAMLRVLEHVRPRLFIPMGHLFAEHVYIREAEEIRRLLPDQDCQWAMMPGDAIRYPKEA